ncbi:N-acetylmuramoyl-L-alanine amidase [Parvicella tangerina]|uniref:N-acetylmuramoyl-L-alanine amidase n=1 Tax=Parvicella tangerina TaxID=2829795 RepID=A0A916JMV9_9FLAO|nr:N-acetylmuramoyl-L-alanine amidase [Parvicella tangerina]CAG5082700.1 hypothetical protein CRYO30217_01986 [Parvicella tangerina]
MSKAKVKYYPEKRIFKRLVVCLMVGFVVGASFAQTGLGVKTVVIDPGHGGKDPGAVGGSDVYEKTVVLKVGLLLGKKIKEAYPEVKVIYTRDKDEFIGLADRASIANKAGADLFISLHCNAAGNKSAKGLESWVLGLHKSAASLEVAKKENNAILMEDGHESTYEDFDPNDPDAYIALAMRQNAFLDQSLVFADYVQKNCVGDLKRHNRGVKQAGFVVLYRATMPSVLVELGFLSHKDEEKFLASSEGQESLASELFDAFVAYKEHKEKVDGLSDDPNEVITVPEKEDEEVVPVTIEETGVIFKVQIATSSLNLPTKPENFKGMTDVEMVAAGKWYKYFVGNYKSIDEAKARQKEVQEIGYDTAFIVAYENGKKINVSEAVKKLN